MRYPLLDYYSFRNNNRPQPCDFSHLERASMSMWTVTDVINRRPVITRTSMTETTETYRSLFTDDTMDIEFERLVMYINSKCLEFAFFLLV